MDRTKQPGLKIAQVFLKAAHFEHRDDVLSFSTDTKVEVETTLNVNVGTTPDGQSGLVSLEVFTNDSKDPLYRFKLEMVGLIAIDAGAPNMSIGDYLGGGAATMMMPFLREALANLTGRGRFGPVWLAPVNLLNPQSVTNLESGAEEKPK